MSIRLFPSPMNTRFRWALGFFSALILVALLTSLRPESLSRFGTLPFQSTPEEAVQLPEDALVTELPLCKPNPEKPSEPTIHPWDPKLALKGAPTSRALENLLEDRAYITTSTTDGFTNQFMGYINMIYLGMLSDRIPILPPFIPNHHLVRGASALPFGDVFNISALRAAIRYPLVEWRDVKDVATSVQDTPREQREQLGCWSTVRPSSQKPIQSPAIFNNLRIDPSFSRIPSEARINRTNPEEIFFVMNDLAPFLYPQNPRAHNNDLIGASSDGQRLPPNEHLACFDMLYYGSTSRTMYEWHTEWSPMWRIIGKNTHFNDALLDITREYIANAFSANINNLPPFVAVHMRRGDFSNSCDQRPNCLIPFSSFENKVEELKKTAEAQFGYPVDKVVLFSDDESEEFWSQANALGWARLDHAGLETIDRYGHWYPTIIDIAAQSMAHAFVGTERSTFSLLSLRRVVDWQHGPTAMVGS